MNRFVLRCLLISVAYLSPQFAVTSLPAEEAGKHYSARISKCICLDQPYQLTEVLTCRAKLRRNQPTLVSVAFVIKEPQPKVWCSFVVFYKYTTYRPFAESTVRDVCQIFDNESKSALMRYVDSFYAKQMAQTMKPCPWEGLFNVTDWYLDEKMMPPILPAGDYRLDQRLFNEANVTILRWQIFFSVRAKGVFDLSMG